MGRPVEVFRYGFEFDGYDAADFRAILDQCIVAVFVSKSESQVSPRSLPPPRHGPGFVTCTPCSSCNG